MIVPNHYENPQLLHENTLPNRAYYLPASHAIRRFDDRSVSDRILFLNGSWPFRYFKSVYDADDSFIRPDTDLAGYDEIPVPGNWQTNGFDTHQYTNVMYPIPFDPPYVPRENPCGCYARDFDYAPDPSLPRVSLVFEGVDSCFYVWLNGHYVGYSQVSHSTSEFDISGYLTAGRNRLSVLVLKWCDGTYLEDQDKFRMSGIFRDVYLIRRPENHVFDFFATTQITDNGASVLVRIKPLKGGIPVSLRLYDHSERLIAAADAVQTNNEDYPLAAELPVDSPILWNAEKPYLYTLEILTDSEVITDRVGIREITIKNNTVLLNGQKIKLRGVNRHDSDPVTGYAVTLEQMKKDLELMKRYNFNAIRCSHYPNSPVFTRLCDEYGFYVIDEADHEAHGVSDIYNGSLDWAAVKDRCAKYLEDNPDYIPAVLDRVQRCVSRDKNRPCVIIWSMGNEAYYGCTTEEALKWTKKFDSTRLTHYEGAYNAGKYRKFDFSQIDLYSRMYPSTDEIRAYLENNPERPMILCEYCHAMGNGPGDLEDYRELIEKYDSFCGGLIWEWCDHAIFKGYADNGKPIYYYGGDHGEEQHDGNFCMDGLVYPDRRPHTGVLEAWNVNRPARVEGFDPISRTITLKNTLDFTDLKECLDLKWSLIRDGDIVAEGIVPHEELPSVLPHQTGNVRIGWPDLPIGKCYLKISYHAYSGGCIADRGNSLGFDEIQLSDGVNHYAAALISGIQASSVDLEVQESERYITVSGSGFRYCFDQLTGMIDCIDKNGPLLQKPVQINLWRAPTDNDQGIKREWYRARYDRIKPRAYRMNWQRAENRIDITADLSIGAVSLQKAADICIRWSVFADGRIGVRLDVRKDPSFPPFPRFGLRFFLDKAFDQVTYFGLGPQESYPDKRRAASHGLYSGSVKDQHEDYLMPQENGSHADCDFVTLKNGESAFSVAAEKPFSFNVSPYTQEELTTKGHAYELEESGCTVLCVDYRMNGIGSNSCGPALLPKYRFDETEFTFSFFIIP